MRLITRPFFIYAKIFLLRYLIKYCYSYQTPSIFNPIVSQMKKSPFSRRDCKGKMDMYFQHVASLLRCPEWTHLACSRTRTAGNRGSLCCNGLSHDRPLSRNLRTSLAGIPICLAFKMRSTHSWSNFSRFVMPFSPPNIHLCQSNPAVIVK